MSTITNDDVRHLAQLSSLQMPDAEIKSLCVDIKEIINYINQLDELDTDGVEPTYQVTGLQNVWRDDEIIDSSVSRQQLLALAAEQSDNCVKVQMMGVKQKLSGINLEENLLEATKNMNFFEKKVIGLKKARPLRGHKSSGRSPKPKKPRNIMRC